MTTLSKQYIKTLARLKRLEAQKQILIVRPTWANPRRYCPTCAKDVQVTTTHSHMTRIELSAVCESCGADLTKKEPTR